MRKGRQNLCLAFINYEQKGYIEGDSKTRTNLTINGNDTISNDIGYQAKIHIEIKNVAAI